MIAKPENVSIPETLLQLRSERRGSAVPRSSRCRRRQPEPLAR